MDEYFDSSSSTFASPSTHPEHIHGKTSNSHVFNFPQQSPRGGLANCLQTVCKPSPECSRPSTGGLPPLIQLGAKARRKSDPPSEPPSPSEAPLGECSLTYSPFEHEYFKDHTGRDVISVWHGVARKGGRYCFNASLTFCYRGRHPFSSAKKCIDMSRTNAHSSMELSNLRHIWSNRHVPGYSVLVRQALRLCAKGCN